ncbi:MAG: hypothetical protein L3J59_12310 [Methylococcaceae bacterium]|nr:hypothetical protein [Methylococcaceae bacterium]
MRKTIYIIFSVYFIFNFSLGFATTFEEANKAYDDKNYIKALYLYGSVIAEEPDNIDAIYWAALAAGAAKKFDRRVNYLKTLKEKDSNGIIPRAMLIHSYQVMGEIEKRDKEHEQLIKLWEKTKYSEESITGYKRDWFSVGDFNIDVFEYFELKGLIPVKYAFKVKVDDKVSFIILMGKHQNMAAKSDMYYLDVFNGKQRYRYSEFNKEPIYDDVRKLAYNIIKTRENNQKKRDKVTDRAFLVKFILPQLFYQSPKSFFSSLNKNSEEYLKSIVFEINDKGLNNSVTKVNLTYSKIYNNTNKIALFKFSNRIKPSEFYYIAAFSSKKGNNINRLFSFDQIEGKNEVATLMEITNNKVINQGIVYGKPTKRSFINAITYIYNRKGE